MKKRYATIDTVDLEQAVIRIQQRHAETLDKETDALHKIIQAYGEDERYVPERVKDLYDKHHAPWERNIDPNAEQNLLKNIQAIHGKEEGLREYNEIMEMERRYKGLKEGFGHE